MDPASMPKESDFNPLEKSKIPIKYKHIFRPMSNFYTPIMRMLAHSWYEIMEFSQNYDHFYFLALENDYEVKVVKFVMKVLD